MSQIKIVMIAGEASGDYLGAKLMRDIKSLCDDNGDTVEFMGAGGPLMENIGLNQILSVDQLSIIGIWEVITKILYFKQLIDDTVKKIIEYNPDVVVTIDFPGFNNRVDKALKKNNPKIPIVHYVAPSVWAWRPDRAEDMHEFVDKLLALFPFEPELFQKNGLDTVFVGHPIATDPDFNEPDDNLKNQFLHSIGFKPRYDKKYYTWRENVRKWHDGAVTVSLCSTIEQEKTVTNRLFREEQRVNFHSNDLEYKIVTLLPGSRKSEIDAHMPVLKELVDLLTIYYKNIRFIIPTIPSLEEHLREYTESWNTIPIITVTQREKIFAYYVSDIAVAASGTVTLELAKAGVPTVVMYKTSSITATIVKYLIKVKYVSLVNILADKEIVPECLQENCVAGKIFSYVTNIIDNNYQQDAQKNQFKDIIQKLIPEDTKIAAKSVLDTIVK